MISQELEFYRPGKLSEAFDLLERHGLDAKILAGGMSLVPLMTLGLMQPTAVISLNHLDDLDYVREEGGALKIGAMTRHATIASHPLIEQHAPLLAEAARCIGDVQVRNRGTFGGSLAHADPAADYLPVALTLGARFRIQRQQGERSVDGGDFFNGLMTTVLEPEELLIEIEIPKLAASAGTSYQRLHRVEGNFAIVAAAGVIDERGARLALGGVGPTPILVDLSDALRGGTPDDDAVSDAAFRASEDAYGDLNGDADYRRAMARVFANRVMTSAASAAAR